MDDSSVTSDSDPSSQSDPTRPESLGKIKEDGVTLKQHPDFLLYMATVNGGKALRYVMIPCLIESLKELSPYDSVLIACEKANGKVDQELGVLDPTNEHQQLPKMESTLKKKFCVGKKFLPL